MTNSKEHLIRGSESSSWGLSGFEIQEEDQQTFRDRLWLLLNHKLVNTAIVVLVLIEGLIIFAELLIDLDIMQDTSYLRPIISCNCSTNSSDYEPPTATELTQPPVSMLAQRSLSHSMSSSSLRLSSPSTTAAPAPPDPIAVRLLVSRKLLSQLSLILVSCFLAEVSLRLICGRSKVLSQPLELFDSILVLVVFVLDVVFYRQSAGLDPNQPGSSLDMANQAAGQEAALLIIVLRLWRIQKIVAGIADDAQAKVLHLLSMCEKEKNQAEHKVDILILKLEDLECELAYQKEKVKKMVEQGQCCPRAANHQLSIMYKKKTTATVSAPSTSGASSSAGPSTNCPCRKLGPLKYCAPADSDDDSSLGTPTTAGHPAITTTASIYSAPSPEPLARAASTGQDSSRNSSPTETSPLVDN